MAMNTLNGPRYLLNEPIFKLMQNDALQKRLTDKELEFKNKLDHARYSEQVTETLYFHHVRGIPVQHIANIQNKALGDVLRPILEHVRMANEILIDKTN